LILWAVFAWAGGAAAGATDLLLRRDSGWGRTSFVRTSRGGGEQTEGMGGARGPSQEK